MTYLSIEEIVSFAESLASFSWRFTSDLDPSPRFEENDEQQFK